MADEGVFFYGAPGTLAPEPSVTCTSPPPSSPAIVRSSNKPPPTRSWAAIAKPTLEQPTKFAPVPLPPREPAALAEEPPRPPPSTVQCSFFLAGGCYFGAACRFRHDAPPSQAAIKWFTDRIALACADAPAPAAEVTDAIGGEERSAEVAPAQTFEEASAMWMSDALRGSSDRSGAGGEASEAGDDDDADGLRAAVSSGVCSSIEAAEAALQAAERAASADVSCAICLDRVLEERGRRFGLLTGCPHAFCLPCIREWRARIDKPTATVRACPVCRTPSFFVIPSDRLLVSARRKAQANEGYTASQRTLPCRLFDQGRGSCAFGSSCWYAHLLPDGTPAVLPKPTYRVDAEGAPASVRSLRLNEFLGSD